MLLLGEEVCAHGLHFTVSDTLLIDGIAVAKTAINDTQFTFIVPAVPGGRRRVQLLQTDGTLLNNNTLNVKPNITGLPPSTHVRPGGTVTLRGNGFSPSPIVIANGQHVEGVHFINHNTLESVLRRPRNIQ